MDIKLLVMWNMALIFNSNVFYENNETEIYFNHKEETFLLFHFRLKRITYTVD